MVCQPYQQSSNGLSTENVLSILSKHFKDISHIIEVSRHLSIIRFVSHIKSQPTICQQRTSFQFYQNTSKTYIIQYRCLGICQIYGCNHNKSQPTVCQQRTSFQFYQTLLRHISSVKVSWHMSTIQFVNHTKSQSTVYQQERPLNSIQTLQRYISYNKRTVAYTSTTF